ncbi:ABC transporter substrate-binding protein [Gordonia sp. DT219]|uniref:ABC transporter substrate-binding protein n=1 Tax=Gordonia sp. DT219 TaxID=3416658 RepID=UPI003CED2707
MRGIEMRSIGELGASRRQFLAGTLGLGATAVLAACGAGGGSGSGGVGAKKLVTAWPADVTTLDPAVAASSQDWEIAFNVYERLVSPKWITGKDGTLTWDGLKIEPQLAEFTMEKDTTTFTIREGAKFHPTGNPVTADDVVYTLERTFALGRSGPLNGAGIQSMDQVSKVDERTVKINFLDYDGKPINANLYLLAVFREPPMGILDSVEVKKHVTPSDKTGSEWLKNNVAGSGPYFIEHRTPGSEIQLSAVPGYAPKPAYYGATIQVIGTGSVLSLLKGGSINFAVYGLTPSDVESVSSSPNLSVIYAKAPEFTLLELGTNGGPFADQAVRQAVGYTLPYDDIINSVYKGKATRIDSYVIEGANGYTPAWAKYQTDIGKATDLMRQAGNPKVTVPLHFLNSDPQMQDTAILIKSNAAKAGIEFVLSPKTPAAFQDLITQRATRGQGSPDALLIKWGSWIDDPATPVGYYTTTGGTNQYSMWTNPEVDKISKEQTFADLTPERAAAYKRAQEIVADAAPLFPIVQAQRPGVLAKGITGMSFSPEMALRYWTLKPA